MDDPGSPTPPTSPPSPEALRRHKQEIARYNSELAAYTLRQWNIARLDAEKKEGDRRRRRMHALAQYAAAGMTSPPPPPASPHSRPPPLLDGTAQYHHSAGGHILMTTRRENRRSFTTSATTTPPSSYQHLHGYQPHHHAHQQHQPHPPTHSQYAQHLQRLENAPSNSEHQRSCATNVRPSNTHAATMSAQLDHARFLTHVQSDSNANSLSQSMSAMAIGPSYRHHAYTYEYAGSPSSSNPSQHMPPPPHPPHTSASNSGGRTAGRHLGTQLLTMTPVHHSHGKVSSSALTSDEDSPIDEPSTEGSSHTSSSSLSRKPRTPQAQDGLIPPPDALGYRPNAAHHHRASMPVPQRKAKEERDAHIAGFKRGITANPGGEGCGTAGNVRHGGGSPGGSLTVRTPGVRI